MSSLKKKSCPATAEPLFQQSHSFSPWWHAHHQTQGKLCSKTTSGGMAQPRCISSVPPEHLKSAKEQEGQFFALMTLHLHCFRGTIAVSSVQSLSHVWLFETPWTAACQAYLSVTNSRSLLKLMPIQSVMPSNHLILYRPLLLLPSIFPSIRVFSSESVLRIRWPKYWSFSFSPSNEYSGLISFRTDWFDLLAVKSTIAKGK